MRWKYTLAWAYLVGVALGDGNLSNPNGRAIRLRVTCATRYPLMLKQIVATIHILLPNNKISFVRVPNKKNFLHISVYSNKLNELIPWRVNKGTKLQQRVRVPGWIKKDHELSIECLRGLLQTDGSIYRDRGYMMVNFTNSSYPLALDVKRMMQGLGYRPTITSTTQPSGNFKYTVRVARETEKFVRHLKLYKA